ncbi:hypothetical protein N781_16380 [Pontibacillus halophilus JSM 076056 = DSM 19796]|uniref:YdbS-like PH domain-containing protein n=1 Tax=Pontibacillus halophilus JSM 076056 = DSM 19796 TaxID=1385510 RepID=A0A0A5I9K2_9BACI|nr:PH domain-containing protein [Pontibacillus halophilus]KGX92487.1 hypothetical protein N781_16380 [Pontibacillus halophilus JSM 076056 = DSM 19796]
MEDHRKQTLTKAATSYFRLSYSITSMILLALTIGGTILLNIFDLALWYSIPLYILVVLHGIYKVGWYAHQYQIHLWYDIQEDRIVVHRGVWTKELITIPMFRIQHATVERGPLLRFYNLANLSFYTAGSTYTIPAMTKAQADTVKDAVINLARAREEY